MCIKSFQLNYVFFTTVHSGNQRSCATSPTILRAPTGYVARVTAQESGYGTDSCPWLVQGQPGQRINITLLDFAIGGGSEDVPLDYCRAYAIIRDKQTGRSTTVCGGHARESVVYLSQSNQVEIRIIRTPKRTNIDHFLLRYEGNHAVLLNMCLA